MSVPPPSKEASNVSRKFFQRSSSDVLSNRHSRWSHRRVTYHKRTLTGSLTPASLQYKDKRSKTPPPPCNNRTLRYYSQKHLGIVNGGTPPPTRINGTALSALSSLSPFRSPSRVDKSSSEEKTSPEKKESPASKISTELTRATSPHMYQHMLPLDRSIIPLELLKEKFEFAKEALLAGNPQILDKKPNPLPASIKEMAASFINDVFEGIEKLCSSDSESLSQNDLQNLKEMTLLSLFLAERLIQIIEKEQL